MGLALLVGLVRHLQEHEVVAMRNAGLVITLQELKDRLEADLALGFDLADSAKAQALLEDTLAHDRRLLAAEVFNAQGISLFNTDRGAIGERVPDRWLAEQSPHWAVDLAGESTLGQALRSPFGELSGQVCVTVGPPSALPIGPLLWVAAGLAVLLSLAAVMLTWRKLAQRLSLAEVSAMEAAAQTLEATRQRLQQTLNRLLDDATPR